MDSSPAGSGARGGGWRRAARTAALCALVQTAAAAGTESVTSTLDIHLRADPSLESRIVAILREGAPAELIERSGEFVRVRRSADGAIGWFKAKYAATAGAGESIAAAPASEPAAPQTRRDPATLNIESGATAPVLAGRGTVAPTRLTGSTRPERLPSASAPVDVLAAGTPVSAAGQTAR